MSAGPLTGRPLASLANLDGTSLRYAVDKNGLSVKVTQAQEIEALGVITGAAGDVTGTRAAGGVFTFAIGALRVLTSMIANLAVTTGKIAANAVTYAKMQQLPANSLLGNFTGSTADPQAGPLSADLAMSGGALGFAHPALPVILGSDIPSGAGGTKSNVTGLLLPVAANKKYWFEFWIRYNADTIAAVPTFNVTVPASPNHIEYESEITMTAGPNTNVVVVEHTNTADGCSGGAVGVDAAGTARFARLRGYLDNGANAGNIQLRHSQTSGSATAATISTLASSFGRFVVTQ